MDLPTLKIAGSLSQETVDRVRGIIDAGTPDTTKRAYASDMRYFWAWAGEVFHLSESYPVSVDVVIRFITDHLYGLDPDTETALVISGLKAKPGTHTLRTIERRVRVLSKVHQLQETDNPCQSEAVKVLLQKAKRAEIRSGGGVQKKKAATGDILRSILDTCDEGRTIDIRDKAILLFGFSSGGRRRSEIVSAQVEDLTEAGHDFVFNLRRSKTDQEGQGHDVPVKNGAALALREWLKVSGISEGPVFRSITKGGKVRDQALSGRDINRIIKRRAKRAGLDPDGFGAHSLRSGFVTEAGRQGKPLPDVMAMSGHKTVGVAMGYYERGNALNNPAGDLL